MTVYFDELETRDPQQRERDLMARLPSLIQRAKEASGWARQLARIHAGAQRIDSSNTQAHPALITIPALARQHDFIVELAGRRPLRRGQAARRARALRSSRGTIGQAPR